MWREYAYQGVNTLSISSAFTVPTGKAHWHTLVRARAIENQCFVIAAAQWGRHNDRIQTFGHSLIIDPWGEILADGLEGEKLLTAELNLSKIETVRKSVKVF
jgi:predicted amidohydrolase